MQKGTLGFWGSIPDKGRKELSDSAIVYLLDKDDYTKKYGSNSLVVKDLLINAGHKHQRNHPEYFNELLDGKNVVWSEFSTRVLIAIASKNLIQRKTGSLAKELSDLENRHGLPTPENKKAFFDYVSYISGKIGAGAMKSGLMDYINAPQTPVKTGKFYDDFTNTEKGRYDRFARAVESYGYILRRTKRQLGPDIPEKYTLLYDSLRKHEVSFERFIEISETELFNDFQTALNNVKDENQRKDIAMQLRVTLKN